MARKMFHIARHCCFRARVGNIYATPPHPVEQVKSGDGDFMVGDGGGAVGELAGMASGEKRAGKGEDADPPPVIEDYDEKWLYLGGKTKMIKKWRS